MEMITSVSGLEQAAQEWLGSPVLALDTEFFWERTFYPILGVVQVDDDVLIALACRAPANRNALGSIAGWPERLPADAVLAAVACGAGRTDGAVGGTRLAGGDRDRRKNRMRSISGKGTRFFWFSCCA